jgi:hypothetical protein
MLIYSKVFLMGVAFAVLYASAASMSGQVPANWPASYPEWWYDADPTRSLIDVSRLDDPGNHSPILQGQLLHMADVGIQELNEQLAPVGGAGFTVEDLRDPSKTPSYDSPAAIGQLKYVASKFYDRFAVIGYQPGSAGWNPDIVLDEAAEDNSPLYPWRNDQTPENMNSALIGQAKHTFAWDLSLYLQEDINPADGIPDWQISYANSLDPSGDYDGDHVPNSIELREGTNPLDSKSSRMFIRVNAPSYLELIMIP